MQSHLSSKDTSRKRAQVSSKDGRSDISVSDENKGFFVSYGKDEKDLKGVLDIGKINDVKIQGKNEFHIHYDGQRNFELKANNTSERDTWVS